MLVQLSHVTSETTIKDNDVIFVSTRKAGAGRFDVNRHGNIYLADLARALAGKPELVEGIHQAARQGRLQDAVLPGRWIDEINRHQAMRASGKPLLEYMVAWAEEMIDHLITEIIVRGASPGWPLHQRLQQDAQ